MLLAAQMSTTDIQLELAYDALLIVDWAQTRTISQDKRFDESNLFLGRNPSLGKVNNFFLAVGLMHFGVSSYLEPENRSAWQNATIAVGLINTYRNTTYGVKLDFPF